MSYIEKLTANNLVSFLRFMDCDKEKGARVSITRGIDLEYEPNTELLFLQSMADKKKYGFLFSDHGLVQIFIDNNPQNPLVSMASEYGCFEQSASCIQFTKSIIGFMASIFKLDYLKDEFNHRETILKHLNEQITLVDQEKTEFEMHMNVLSGLMDDYNTKQNSLEKYLNADNQFMYFQHLISAQNEYLQELYNFKNYHSKIQAYVKELALDLFSTNIVTGEKINKESFKKSLETITASTGEFQA
ncbi:MAG: hypothetical protein IJW24_02745 [Clostridia bacterium]|nr:hypothetical protein [Clostridia bacterium]